MLQRKRLVLALGAPASLAAGWTAWRTAVVRPGLIVETHKGGSVRKVR